MWIWATTAAPSDRGRDVFAVGTPCEGVDPVSRFAEGVEQLGAGDVEDLDGAIGAAGGEQLSVGTEANGIDGVAVFFERPDMISSDELHRCVKTGSCYVAFLTAVSDIKYHIRVQDWRFTRP